MTTKQQNRTLAALIRAYGGVPNGDTWATAKARVKDGASLETAAFAAVTRITEAAVTQAPAKKAPKRKSPKVTPVQAQRVARGEVMRDTKGRIVSREVQSMVEELATL